MVKQKINHSNIVFVCIFKDLLTELTVFEIAEGMQAFRQNLLKHKSNIAVSFTEKRDEGTTEGPEGTENISRHSESSR